MDNTDNKYSNIDNSPDNSPAESEQALTGKSRRRMSFWGGIAAVMLVVGVAAASYLVSSALKSRQAIAPTAPTGSFAANCSSSSQSPCQGAVVGSTCGPSNYICRYTSDPSDPSDTCVCSYQAPTASPTSCVNGTKRCVGSSAQECISGAWSGQTCAYGCRNGECNECSPDGSKRCVGNGAEVCTLGEWSGQTCAHGCRNGECNECSPDGSKRCVGNGAEECVLGEWAGQTCAYGCSNGNCNAAPTASPTATPAGGGYCSPANSTSCGSCYTVSGTCVKSCSKCSGSSGSWWTECPGGCGGGGGGSSSGGGAGSCDSSKRDAPASNSINFSKAGTIKVFTRNPYDGTITLTGPKTVNITLTKGDAQTNPTTFTVNAGETYTIKVRITGEGGDSYGWRANKSTNICGPTYSVCGEDKDITAVRNLAIANSDMSGITAGGANASIQCWADYKLGDPTQDYDFNDFTILFGYSGGTRQDYCSSASVSKTPLAPGENVVFGATSNTPVNNITWAMYNMDNLYGPGNPKPFCVGSDPILPSCSELDPYGNPNCACPQGGHQLIIADPNTALRTTGSATVSYDTLFNQPDRRNGDKKVTHAAFMAYFSLTGGPVSLPNANCKKLIDASTVSVVPNCTNISGPATLTLGQTGTYSAKFVAAESGGLTDGSIFYSTTVGGVDQKDIHDLFSNPYNRPVSNGQTLTTTFKPSAVGTYWLRCRAWNDGIAECRPPATVDGPPRFNCTGPGYEMKVTVTAAPPATPTLTATAQCSTGKSVVALSWNSITGANDYYIYRCSGSGCTPTTQLTTVNSPTVSYIDQTVTAGTIYSYRVRAHRSSDNQFSEYSASKQVTASTCVASCRGTCNANITCASGFTCQGSVCRNSTCPTTDDTSCACPPAPMCVKASMFELKNNQWTVVTNPSSIKAGTAIRFGASGNISASTKARFRINGGDWVETTTKMTVGGVSYFYIDHTLVTGDYTVSSAVQ